MRWVSLRRNAAIWWASGDSTTAWLKEVRAAEGKRFESVVLFAIDQFCLIGYDVPLPGGSAAKLSHRRVIVS